MCRFRRHTLSLHLANSRAAPTLNVYRIYHVSCPASPGLAQLAIACRRTKASLAVSKSAKTRTYPAVTLCRSLPSSLTTAQCSTRKRSTPQLGLSMHAAWRCIRALGGSPARAHRRSVLSCLHRLDCNWSLTLGTLPCAPSLHAYALYPAFPDSSGDAGAAAPRPTRLPPRASSRPTRTAASPPLDGCCRPRRSLFWLLGGCDIAAHAVSVQLP